MSSLHDAMVEYAKIVAEERAHDEVGKDISARKDAAKELLLAVADAEGVKKLPVYDDCPKLTLAEQVWTSTLDKAAVNQWIVEQGFDHMRTVNAQTLNAFVNERIEAGLSLPSGIETKPRRTVRVAGARGGNAE